MKINISENLQKLAKIFGKKTDLYVVGGYIRDQLLGLKTNDIDLCSSLTITQIQTLLIGSKYTMKETNKKLGTAKICCEDEIWEYSTFRKEVYADDGSHSPIQVEFIKSVQQDAQRRDFTVNSIYYNINKQEILDFYNGTEDIKKRKIKCIETPEFVFNNDGLRILRMIRQASLLNFSIDKETFQCAKKRVYLIKDISNQRKLSELELILNSKNKYIFIKKCYVKALKQFNNLGIWKYYFENINFIKYNTVKKVNSNNRFAGLLIDIVKTVKPDCISYYLEQLVGVNGLNIPKVRANKEIEVVCGYFDALNLLNNKDYFFTYFNAFARISEILEKSAPFVHRKYNFFYKYIIRYKVPIQIKDLKINGNDIKLNYPKIPQKKYNYILTDLLNKVFRAELDNHKECLLAEVKEYDM